MTEQKKSDRKIVIALTVICIILAASLIGVLAIYLTQPPQTNSNQNQDQLRQKDNIIGNLTNQIASLQQQLNANSNSQDIDELNNALAEANRQLAYAYNIIYFNASDTIYSEQALTQQPNTYTEIFNGEFDFAGYVVINAQSTSNTTYAETLYNSFGANFDYNTTLGTSGTAVFPVLPGTVAIRIGNIDQVDVNNATISLRYYY